MLELTVNGKLHHVDVEPGMPLLWVLRDFLGLPGAKYACGISVCGACTVHVDGQAARSCTMPAGAAVGRKIVTIEGLSEGTLHRVQQAWIEHEVPQCGYCQTGLIMSVAALLAVNPKPTDTDIDAAITNLCRCGTYARVRKAIHALAGQSPSGQAPSDHSPSGQPPSAQLLSGLSFSAQSPSTESSSARPSSGRPSGDHSGASRAGTR